MMNRQKNMFLFYFSITLAIVSSALYHFSQKATPADVHPAVAIMVTYAVAFCLVLVLFFFLPTQAGFLAELRHLNWASFLLAFSIVGLEIGFLLVYRSGWNIGIAAVLVNVVASLLLIPIALFVFKQTLSLVNIIGILVCLAGLVMLNWKR
jgi:drug/metabolite transporter (DMT)-like permease